MPEYLVGSSLSEEQFILAHGLWYTTSWRRRHCGRSKMHWPHCAIVQKDREVRSGTLSFPSFTQANNPSVWDKGCVFFPQLNLSGNGLKDLPRGMVPRWSTIFPSWQSRLDITRFYTGWVVYCVYSDFGGTRTYISCPVLSHLLWLLPQRSFQSST